MKTVAASILCFCNTSSGTKFLLGRERIYRSRNKGCDNTWSDFGGKSELNESPYQTAAREFFEETAASIPFNKNLHHCPDIISKALKNEFYFKRIDFPVSGGKIYTTFVCEVPDTDLRDFNSYRRAIEELSKIKDHPSISKLEIHDGYLEKTKLSWFSIETLALALEQQGNIYDDEGGRKLGKFFMFRFKKILEDWPTKVDVDWRQMPKISNGFVNFNRRR